MKSGFLLYFLSFPKDGNIKMALDSATGTRRKKRRLLLLLVWIQDIAAKITICLKYDSICKIEK